MSNSAVELLYNTIPHVRPMVSLLVRSPTGLSDILASCGIARTYARFP